MRQLWDSSTGDVVGLPSKRPEKPPVKVTSLCKACPGRTPNLRLVPTGMRGGGQLLVTAGPLTATEWVRHKLAVQVRAGSLQAKNLSEHIKLQVSSAAFQFLVQTAGRVIGHLEYRVDWVGGWVVRKAHGP